LHAGYKVSLSHAHRSSIKTNAPASVIWVRCTAHNAEIIYIIFLLVC